NLTRPLRPLLFRPTEELVYSRHPMLEGRGEDGLAQGDRFQVVAAADLRLRDVLQGAEQLRHRADEGVREPHLVPARRHPLARLAARGVVEGAGSARGVARPADGAAGQSLGALDAPADADVGGAPLARRPGPDVVPGTGSDA